MWSAALGPLYTDEVYLSVGLLRSAQQKKGDQRLHTSWTLSTKEDTSSTNAIHRTSERMAASLTNRTLAQAAEKGGGGVLLKRLRYSRYPVAMRALLMVVPSPFSSGGLVW